MIGCVVAGIIGIVLGGIVTGGYYILPRLGNSITDFIASVAVILATATLILVAIQIWLAVRQDAIMTEQTKIIRAQEEDRLRNPDLSLQWQYSGKIAGEPNPLFTMGSAPAQENTPLGLRVRVHNLGKSTTGLLLELWLPRGMEIIADHEFHNPAWIRREPTYDVGPPLALLNTRYTVELPMLRIAPGPPIDLGVIMAKFAFKRRGEEPYTIKYRLTSEGHVFPKDAIGFLRFMPMESTP
jgi:hypothetical protein